MKQSNPPASGAEVTITGEGHEISGGALIGCGTRQDPSIFAYAYVLQGLPYAVTGTPETTWAVRVNGADYSFPASENGLSWTAEPMEVAAIPINITGKESDESPGSLVYWPMTTDANGFVEPPTSGSTGVYYDAKNLPHTVEFRTTWSVLDFQTTFTWTGTDPFGGPYTSHTRSPLLGDNDTWVAGEPPPGTGPGTGGTE